MKIETAPSYPVSIFIAGDRFRAEKYCREHCDDVGLCVTVTATNYVYRDGNEAGVVVGLINYPRFPKEAAEIWAIAEELGRCLRVALQQESFTIQAPDKTVWFSWREADL